MKLLIVAFFVLLITGCASAPSEEEIANAYYGKDHSQSECERIVESVLSSSLKDPGSAQWQHGSCYKGWSSSLTSGKNFGWILRGSVNGKNSYGGYTGFSAYQAVIRDNRLVASCIANSDGLCMMM